MVLYRKLNDKSHVTFPNKQVNASIRIVGGGDLGRVFWANNRTKKEGMTGGTQFEKSLSQVIQCDLLMSQLEVTNNL